MLRLQRPEKTSRTSSKPPATDRKERREQAKPGGAKPGHEGHSRVMSEDPDAVVEHRPGSLRVLRRRPARGSSRRGRQRLRADRAAGGGAGRHPASTAGGAVPDLRGAGGRAGSGGGARHALRPAAACGGDVSQDLPGAVLRAAAGGAVGSVRAHAQPGRADEPAPARAEALPLRSRRGRLDPAPRHGGRLGRDRRAHRGQQRLPLGLPFGRSGGASRPRRRGAPSWCGR